MGKKVEFKGFITQMYYESGTLTTDDDPVGTYKRGATEITVMSGMPKETEEELSRIMRLPGQVRVTIEDIFDRGLPQAYTPGLYQKKCDAVYQHVYDSYFGAGKSIYAFAT